MQLNKAFYKLLLFHQVFPTSVLSNDVYNVMPGVELH